MCLNVSKGWGKICGQNRHWESSCSSSSLDQSSQAWSGVLEWAPWTLRAGSVYLPWGSISEGSYCESAMLMLSMKKRRVAKQNLFLTFPFVAGQGKRVMNIEPPFLCTRERGAHATLWIWDNLHNATLFSLANNRKWVISSNCFRLEIPQTTSSLQLNVIEDQMGGIRPNSRMCFEAVSSLCKASEKRAPKRFR